MVYSEEFSTLAEARRREYEIKLWKSSRRIAELIGKARGESGPP
jgi:predicted GIY-YIG superfamily endonuclease